MNEKSVPETASNAMTGSDGRQFAPSTPRNKEPILTLLKSRLGDHGRYLEIASGTGEHIVHFAQAFPDWRFQPTEMDPERIASIQAWILHSGLTNIAPPATLNAAQSGWGKTVEVDAINMCNLFHLISENDMRVILNECAHALAPNGKLIIYGPFMRAGELTSEGDEAFHASIISHNPKLGYKDDFDMLEWIETSGLIPDEVIEMPANNLALIATKSTT
ncbi:MAG: DUF938 domain-containing protein [Paracoccaceae bacterium]|nr:DUF938 domain-containing protein [Paracoccaceae bacterium]MDG2258049.1 DUF938 domain-containing protein [Paracoccaceae bacterium]